MAAAATCLRTTALSQGLASSAPIEKDCSVHRSAFFGAKTAPKNALRQKLAETRARVACAAEKNSKWGALAKEAPKEKKADRWGGLGKDMSDDQQDIARGRGMVDSLFQGQQGLGGTQNPIMSSYDYISSAQRTLSNISQEGYYISPSFMDKLVIHITKNFLKLPNIKVPLILGVWGGKGQGKSFQAELVFSMLGINPIVMSAGELESGNAGEPAKLIRQRYREAADIIKKGKMCALFINDLDAGAGRMGGTTQYTVNNQMVNATLMNIADNPNNVQLPGVYNKEENPRVPIIVTGNDFSTLYAPLIRDGRMEKFYWAPTREDRIGVCTGIFKEDKMNVGDITTLVDNFPGQSIDFFGALRSRVYDDLVREWVDKVGYENLGKSLVNAKSGPPSFEKPQMTLDILLEYGNKLVEEQENVKRVQFAEEYLSGAALGDANADSIASGSFYAGKAAQQNPPPLREGCTDPNSKNFDPTARSDDGSCEYDFAEAGKDGPSSPPAAKPAQQKNSLPAAKQSSPRAERPASRPDPRSKKAASRPDPRSKKAEQPKQQDSFFGSSSPSQDSFFGSPAPPQQQQDSFFGSSAPKGDSFFGGPAPETKPSPAHQGDLDLDAYLAKSAKKGDSFFGGPAPETKPSHSQAPKQRDSFFDSSAPKSQKQDDFFGGAPKGESFFGGPAPETKPSPAHQGDLDLDAYLAKSGKKGDSFFGGPAPETKTSQAPKQRDSFFDSSAPKGQKQRDSFFDSSAPKGQKQRDSFFDSSAPKSQKQDDFFGGVPKGESFFGGPAPETKRSPANQGDLDLDAYLSKSAKKGDSFFGGPAPETKPSPAHQGGLDLDAYLSKSAKKGDSFFGGPAPETKSSQAPKQRDSFFDSSAPKGQKQRDSFFDSSAPKGQKQRDSFFDSSAPKSQKQDDFFGGAPKGESFFGGPAPETKPSPANQGDLDLDAYLSKSAKKGDSFFGGPAPETKPSPANQGDLDLDAYLSKSAKKGDSFFGGPAPEAKTSQAPKATPKGKDNNGSSNGTLDTYLKKVESVKPFW